MKMKYWKYVCFVDLNKYEKEKTNEDIFITIMSQLKCYMIDLKRWKANQKRKQCSATL